MLIWKGGNMVTDNNEIKKILRANGLPQWKIADKIGIHEVTLCRMLRKPVTEEIAGRIEEAITELTKQSDE